MNKDLILAIEALEKENVLRGRYLGKAACRRGFPYPKRQKIRRNTLKSHIFTNYCTAGTDTTSKFPAVPLFSFKKTEKYLFFLRFRVHN